MLRVAFLTNIVSPYRRPLFERLAREEGWDFRIFVNAATEGDRRWQGIDEGLPVRRSWSLTWRRKVRVRKPVRNVHRVEMHVPLGLPKDLWSFRPDVVVTHELGPRSALAALYCKLTHTPLVTWCYQSRASSTAGGFLRRLVRRFVLRASSKVVGMGTQARDVLRTWGVDDSKIYDALNAPDLACLDARMRSVDYPESVAAVRSRLPAGRRVAMVVGRLVEMKGIRRILSAWQQLPVSIRESWCLAFVGEGPLAGIVRDREHEGVFHLGYAPHRELADYFGAADVQLFASLADVWGLVANESMYCGVPVLCSELAGCTDDLIDDGRNGWVIRPQDANDLKECLERVLALEDYREIGERARQQAGNFTIENMARGFLAAVQDALSAAREPCIPVRAR